MAASNCSVPNCDRQEIAKGFCNAHYLRSKKGLNMDTPIRKQEFNRTCSRQGCDEKHYGNNLCVKHWRVWNRYETKLRLIEMLGGCCSKCKQKFHPAAYDFHHVDPKQKEFSITSGYQNMSFDKIYQEVKKCILLCANCHRIEHAGDYLEK